MKRLATLALIITTCGIAAACGNDRPTSASNANRIVFTSQLRASNEVPPSATPNRTGAEPPRSR